MRAPYLAVILALAVGTAGCRRETASSFTPGLGEIMTLNQMRHSKLWFAGQAGNWPLAAYEIDELEEGLADAATFHPTHKDAPLPIPDLIDKMMKEPVAQLRRAVEAKDRARFDPAYDELTDACNRCHQATNFGFNRVTRPQSNPYSNQQFEGAADAAR